MVLTRLVGAGLLAVLPVGTIATVAAVEPQAGQLDITVGPETLTVGGTVTVRTDFTTAEDDVVGAEVQLWRLPYGGEWELAGTDVTSPFGTAALAFAPRRRVTYQWRFQGSDAVSYTESMTATVRVRAKVSLKIQDDTVRRGQRVVLTGRTTPAKPGIRVTIWRGRAVGGDEVWFSGQADAEGKYRFARRARIGAPLRLYARIPGASGNLKATSDVEWLYVSG